VQDERVDDEETVPMHSITTSIMRRPNFRSSTVRDARRSIMVGSEPSTIVATLSRSDAR
jgi:hypothetical protein